MTGFKQTPSPQPMDMIKQTIPWISRQVPAPMQKQAGPMLLGTRAVHGLSVL